MLGNHLVVLLPDDFIEDVRYDDNTPILNISNRVVNFKGFKGGNIMLTVYCKAEPDNMLYTANEFFDQLFENTWFDDPLVEEMVIDIDKTKHISGAVFDSPFLGIIPPQNLSHGVKALIYILKFENRLNQSYRSTMFGDNCIPWLCKLSETVDFSMYLCHPMALHSRANKGALKINAVTEDGLPLKTCGEVFDYYIEEFKDVKD